MEKRTIIVGDVHGCLEEFDRLLDKLRFRQGGDRLISVGDLINKGPDSVGVLERARKIGCEVVMGNHERNFVLRATDPHYPKSGYFAKLAQEMGGSFPSWLDWMKSLPTFIEEEDFLVVHAGLEPGVHPSRTGADILTRIRTWDGRGTDLYAQGDPPWFDLYRGEKPVIFGHWAALGLMVRPNAVCLDSGCVYGRQLSALVLPERKIVQVDAGRVYEPVKQMSL